MSVPEDLGTVHTALELQERCAEIQNRHPSALLLFRGQTQKFSKIRSGLARAPDHFQPDVDRGWSAIVGRLLDHSQEVKAPSIPLRKAVLQHYGVPTHYLDLTSDPSIAAWFAMNQIVYKSFVYVGDPPRHIRRAYYETASSNTGVVIVLAIEDPDTLVAQRRLFDVRGLCPFLRSERQQAWLLLDRQPLLPDPNSYWVATIHVSPTAVRSDLTMEYLLGADPSGHVKSRG